MVLHDVAEPPTVTDVNATVPAVDDGPDVAAAIRSLAALHSDRILTDVEFTAKKAQLLDRM